MYDLQGCAASSSSSSSSFSINLGYRLVGLVQYLVHGRPSTIHRGERKHDKRTGTGPRVVSSEGLEPRVTRSGHRALVLCELIRSGRSHAPRLLG